MLLYAVTAVEDVRCIDLVFAVEFMSMEGTALFAPALIRCEATVPSVIELIPLVFPSNLPVPIA